MLKEEETVIAVFIMKLGETGNLSLLPVAKQPQLSRRSCNAPVRIGSSQEKAVVVVDVVEMANELIVL